MHQAVEIFISYANPDLEKATELGQRLAENGFRPYLEPKDEGSGSEEAADIRRAVRAADFFLLCLSGQATNATRLLDGQQQKTLDLFLNDTGSTAFLVPVRLEQCTVPKSLRAFVYEAERYKLPVDLFEQDGWQELLQTINLVLERRAQVDQEFLELSEAELPDEQPAVDNLDVENFPRTAFDEGPDDPSSVDQWELELRRVLDGEREYAIEQLGLIEYLEVKIEEALDRAAAKTAFHRALRRIVETWQPLAEHERYDSYVLDLILTYTPPEGFVKVADIVSTIDLEPQTFLDEVPSDRIVMKALYALEAILPLPPLAEDRKAPAYRRYVDLLQNRILDERYSFYAVRRLLELGEIHPESTDVQPLIDITHALHALVSALLEPVWRSVEEPGLTNLYHLCLDSDEHQSNFATSVSEEGWVMEYGENQLVLSRTIDPPQTITIQILDEYKQKFYIYSDTSLLKKMDEILAAAAASR